MEDLEATKCLPQSGKVETGHDWDEPLFKFKNGSININYYNNVIGYEAGAMVSGTIDIDLKEGFPHFEDLVIEFVGLERSFLTDGGNLEPKPFQRESKEIIKLKQVSRVFKGAGISKG